MKYENWRLIHALCACLSGRDGTYVFVEPVQLAAIQCCRIWTGIIALVGICSGVYTIFFYQKSGFKYSGKVYSYHKLTSSIAEIEITLDQKIDYVKGQYFLWKIFQNGIENAPHPSLYPAGMEGKSFWPSRIFRRFYPPNQQWISGRNEVSWMAPMAYGLQSRQNQPTLIAGGMVSRRSWLTWKGMKPINRLRCITPTMGKQRSLQRFLEDYQKNNKNFKVNLIYLNR